MARDYTRILMVYPEFEPSYWGLQYALPIIGRKSLMPPLGLLTIAALTPPKYEIRLADLNVGPLSEQDLEWADMVLFSAMLVQKNALFAAAERCRAAGKLIVFGGPYPTACPDECSPYCDVLVLNEGEITWPQFLRDLEAGHSRSLYGSEEKPDIRQTPAPRFDLIRTTDYVSIPIQFSRGCPYTCEFCDIIVLFGRRPRTKTPAQVLGELEVLLATGYKGQVFIVDDNFIGNKAEALKLAVELERWNREHGYPFSFGTEATVNLADEPALLKAMVDAGFVFVFLGIETPSLDSLKETGKHQNLRGPLLEKVERMQRAGLLVYGGFIVGFDNDPDDIFDRQIAFITEGAIGNAMVGPLMALPGTPLFDRMRREGRLLNIRDYDTWYESGFTNIRTVMPRRALLNGYRKIVETVYDPRHYFERSLRGLERLPRGKSLRDRWEYLRRTVAGGGFEAPPGAPRPSLFEVVKGLAQLYRSFPAEFRRALGWFLRRILLRCPEQLPRAASLIFMGYHNYRYTRDHVVPKVEEALNRLEALESEGVPLQETGPPPFVVLASER